MTKQFDPRQFVHTPAEMMTEYVQWAESIKADPGIPFGIPCIDEKVIPMRPGNLVCFLGRPGHGKSSILVYLARAEGQRILARGAQNDEVVVYVTWEQSSEELTAMLMADPSISYSDIAWGRADLDAVKRKAIKGVTMPVWVIGYGLSRDGLQMPRMTPDLVLGAIESMKADFGVKVRMMLFDYLQLIPIEGTYDRMQQVTQMPFRLKELAQRVQAPAIAAVQARRDVDDRAYPMPQMQDGQWSSAIEQTADKTFGLWRPVKSLDRDEQVEVKGKTFDVRDELLIIEMHKQRGDQGDWTWGMYFDPALMRLAELETEVIDFKEPVW
jgi:replicative DNA helicase